MTTDKDETFANMLGKLIDAIAAADEIDPDYMAKAFEDFITSTAQVPPTPSQRVNAHMVFMAGAISVLRALGDPLTEFKATKDVPTQAMALNRMFEIIDALNAETRKQAQQIIDKAKAGEV